MELSWQEQLRDAVRSVRELSGYAFVNPEACAIEEKYRVLVPRYYLNLIDPEDANDPIARMAFPQKEELELLGFRDPIGDLAQQAAGRLTHRYRDRALLHVTNLCPMYCRFCFRKNLMNEGESELYSGDFTQAFSYLHEHREIEELILTGGDPWMLSDERLSSLVDQIASGENNIKRLRFHTRMPVTLPSRIGQKLIEAISRPGRFITVIVTHFNHPREITAIAAEGIAQLRAAGFTVLNQSVLLRGVNDSTAILRELFVRLGEIGILPYYLHHCDTVSGASHFRMTIDEGMKIWSDLRGNLPGYLLPEYVLDVPGGLGKIPLSNGFIEKLGVGRYFVRSRGKEVEYFDPPMPSHA